MSIAILTMRNYKSRTPWQEVPLKNKKYRIPNAEVVKLPV